MKRRLIHKRNIPDCRNGVATERRAGCRDDGIEANRCEARSRFQGQRPVAPPSGCADETAMKRGTRGLSVRCFRFVDLGMAAARIEAGTRARGKPRKASQMKHFRLAFHRPAACDALFPLVAVAGTDVAHGILREW